VAPATRELVDAERGRRAEALSSQRATQATPPAQAGARHTTAAEVYPLVVTATPDDRPRLTGELDWDEAARPSAPTQREATFTVEQQSAAQHLVDIHDALRGDLTRLRDVIEQVAAGEEEAHRARTIINELAMRQNNWTLGAYCAQYCRVVTGHHTLEDRSVFPHLRRSEAQLAPVLDRLEREHHVIHDVLEQLDRALVATVSGEGDSSGVQRVVDLLTDTLLSHLAYEERELIEPLARYGFA
jgi:hemerythrin-like domain-containing protein